MLGWLSKEECSCHGQTKWHDIKVFHLIFDSVKKKYHTIMYPHNKNNKFQNKHLLYTYKPLLEEKKSV